jgi:DNA-binding transcriptional ArsR family regulator
MLNGPPEPASGASGSFGGATALSDAARRATAFLKALAHEARLEILCQLIDGEKTVSQLTEALNISQAAVSLQLMRLRNENLVSTRRAGRNIHYSLERPEVVSIIRELQFAFCRPEADSREP